jgi:iron complex transport system substrate-binding protein
MARPTRIVSLVASNTEILYALGVGDRVVGVDDFSDYPPAVATQPRVGRDQEIDVERVAALRPDLVLASLSVPGMERNVERLEGLKLPYVAIHSRGLDGVVEDVRRIAELVGVAAAGERLAAALCDRIERVADRARSVDEPVDLYWEWWPRPYVTAGGPSWITDLCRLAGGRNVFSDLEQESATVSTADVVARSPAAVVACWCGARKLPDPSLVARRDGWEVVPAVRDGRVYALLEPLYGRPGPRLVDGLEELASLLHPQSTLGDGHR